MKTYYWHIHHEVIADPSYNVKKRKKYVRIYKPTNEVETRLRLMTPAKDQDFVGKAWEEYNEIRVKAYEKYKEIEDKTYEKYKEIEDKALEKYNASLWELHKKEHPDCPWDGKTIFPGKDVQ